MDWDEQLLEAALFSKDFVTLSQAVVAYSLVSCVFPQCQQKN